VILRCTKKLLAVLGAGSAAEPGPPQMPGTGTPTCSGLTGASACCSRTPPPCFRSSGPACGQETCAQPAA